MSNNILQRFNEEFLYWFRELTEGTWRNYRAIPFEKYVASRVGGSDWQQGTRWLNGLSEQEITAIEQRYHLRFPPDYHLFLQVLHSVDRPRVGAGYGDDNNIIPITAPSFCNWQTDAAAIQYAYERLVSGLLFDVQHDDLWSQSWGAKPTTAKAQEARVRELVNAAPKLVPVFAHRYLLAEPCEAGNPVLSIMQSDIIIYDVNLHDYFLDEFGDLCGISSEDRQQLKAASKQKIQDRFEAYLAIPFWGEFL